MAGHCRSCTHFTPGRDGTGWCELERARFNEMGGCPKYAPIYDERHGRPAQPQPKNTRKAEA
jgi:hypothetical protein